MWKSRWRILLCVLLLSPITERAARAELRLPSILSDHMVLQAGVPLRIWGWAEAGGRVTVSFEHQSFATVARNSGFWEVFLHPLRAGGPYEMIITARDRVVIQDVLVGEVWVASGQSNMERPLLLVNHAEAEIAAANYPQIRLFLVRDKESDVPLEDVEGSWKICTPESVPHFSAIGYFFARNLYLSRHVPVGLIDSSWGGTPGQSWLRRVVMENDKNLQSYIEEWNQTLADFPSAFERYQKSLGEWRRLAAEAKPRGIQPPPEPKAPLGPGHRNTPGGLWNAMILPLTRYAIRGVLWYQGESDADPKHAYRYRYLFRALIEDWRCQWQEGNFPFLFVQLANYAGNPNWPLLRESQSYALGLRNTAMIVTIDIGDSHDVHPKNKQDVALRLSLAAQALAYGEPVEYSGPVFRQATREGNRVRLYFDHAASGLRSHAGTQPQGFELAGADNQFVPAQTQIEGTTVLLQSAKVPVPIHIRYGWADDPHCTLENGNGLPASPFRADVD